MNQEHWNRWMAEVREDFPYFTEDFWKNSELVTLAATTAFELLPVEEQGKLMLAAITGALGPEAEFTEKKAGELLFNFLNRCALTNLLKEGKVTVNPDDGRIGLTEEGLKAAKEAEKRYFGEEPK